MFFYFIISILCTSNMSWIYAIITNQRPNKSFKYFPLFFLGGGLLTLCFYLEMSVAKAFVSLFLLFFVTKLIYKNEMRFLFFHSFYVWVVGMIIDIVFMIVFSFMCNQFDIIIEGTLGTIMMFVATLLLQMFYNLISRRSFYKNVVKTIYSKAKIIKINSILTGIFIIAIIFLGYWSSIHLNNTSIIISFLLISVLLLWIIILLVQVKYLKKIYAETNNLLLENNQVYTNLNLETRMFKHNLKHKLEGIRIYGNKKVNSMIDEILIECGQLSTANTEIDKLPKGLNGLIFRKIYESKAKNVDFLVNNHLKSDIFELVLPRNYNKLCEVLGVTLDNALEAFSDESESILHILIEDDSKNVFVTIQNTFSSTIDVDKLGVINYTTKGKNHGIGIFSILFHNELKTNIKIVNNIFETKIQIKKSSNY